MKIFRMTSYIDKFESPSKNQLGFPKKHKTIDALSYVFGKIRSVTESKNPSCCVVLDLKKTFDTSDHDIMLCRFFELGFRGPVYSSLKSHLSNMKFLKRSGLTLLLFLLFIKDVPSHCAPTITLFAEHKNVFDQLQSNYHISSQRLLKHVDI